MDKYIHDYTHNTKLELFYLIGGIGETTIGEIENINHKQTSNQYFTIYRQIITINLIMGWTTLIYIRSYNEQERKR